MKQAMKKWLGKFQIPFNPEEAQSLCNKLELEGEKADGCYMLVADLEAGRIDNGEFTAGLSVLTGKKPEEVMGILKGMENKEPWQMTKKEYLSEFPPKFEYERTAAIRKANLERGRKAREKHRQLVETALTEGKSVPAEVLEDYPDLREVR